MSLNPVPMPTAADINRLTYLGAAKLKKEMSRPGGGQPEKLDFSIMASCSNCDAMGHKVLQEPPKWHMLLTCVQQPLVCSGCTVYCSKKVCLTSLGNWVAGASDGCSVKSRIGKTGDLAQKAISFSAKKTRWVRFRSSEV